MKLHLALTALVASLAVPSATSFAPSLTLTASSSASLTRSLTTSSSTHPTRQKVTLYSTNTNDSNEHAELYQRKARPAYRPGQIDDPDYVRIFDTTLRDGEQSPGFPVITFGD